LQFNNIIILGIILSIIFYEFTDISPGGIIVPGYIVFYLNQPVKIVVTIIIGLSALAIVNWLSKHLLIYGRRKFAAVVIVSFLLVEGFGTVVDIIPVFVYGTTVIGTIIPGVLGNECGKQGTFKTLASMMVVVLLLKLCIIFVGSGNMI